jgi:hypothetical protein
LNTADGTRPNRDAPINSTGKVVKLNMNDGKPVVLRLNLNTLRLEVRQRDPKTGQYKWVETDSYLSKLGGGLPFY